MNLDDYITMGDAHRALGLNPRRGDGESLLETLAAAGLVTLTKVGSRFVLSRQHLDDVARHYRPYMRREVLIAALRKERIEQALQEVAE